MGSSASGLICRMKKTLVERVDLCASRFDQTIQIVVISSQIYFKRSSVYSAHDDDDVSL